MAFYKVLIIPCKGDTSWGGGYNLQPYGDMSDFTPNPNDDLKPALYNLQQ